MRHLIVPTCLFFIANTASNLGGLSVAQADDWPQWLGPNRNLSSGESGLLKEWPDGGPKRVWLFEDCGVGYSGPAIFGDKLYILGAREGVTQLMAISTASGDEQWSVDLAEKVENDWGDGPRSTPTVEGDRIYVLTGAGALACISTDGKEVWKASMQEQGGSVPYWGYSESPLLHGDHVIVTPGGEQGAIVAFNKLSGEVVWRSEQITDGAHYSSIIYAEPNGQPQLIQLLEKRLVGISPTDGKLLWETPWPGRIAVVPTPIFHDNHVYITSGYGIGSKLVKIEPDNQATEVYFNKIMKNHHGGVKLLDGHIYGHSDKVGWVCQNLMTGERVWRERSALGKGSIGYADGMLYCYDKDSGEVALIRPNTDQWEEHGRFTLDPQTKIRKDRGKLWTHPVVAGGKLYVRDQDLLHCYDVRDN